MDQRGEIEPCRCLPCLPLFFFLLLLSKFSLIIIAVPNNGLPISPSPPFNRGGGGSGRWRREGSVFTRHKPHPASLPLWAGRKKAKACQMPKGMK